MFTRKVAAVVAMASTMLLLGCTIGGDSNNNNDTSQQESNEAAIEQESDAEVQPESNDGAGEQASNDGAVEQGSDEGVLQPDTDDEAGEQEPGADTNQSETNNETSQPGPGENADSNAVTEYNGNWIDACRLRVPGEYLVILYTISSDTYSSTTYHYTDRNCTQPNARYAELTFEASVVYPGGTTQTDLGNARHIDITVETVLVNGVEASESMQSDYQALGVYNTRHTLVHLADGKLYTGKESFFYNGITAAKRPLTLNTTNFAVRQ